MRHAFRPDDQSAESGLRRIADAILVEALATLDRDAPPCETIPAVRHAIRKLRGLLRMVKPVFPGHGIESGVLRDAARGVVDLSDSAAMVGIADRMRPYLATLLTPALAEDLHRLLERDRAEREALEDVPGRLHRLKVALLGTAERAGSWSLAAEEGAALSGGIAQTFGRGQAALAIAERSRRPEDFADLRKQIRYHRGHAVLLRPMMEGPMDAHLALADAALEALDAHRELTLLAALLNRLQGRLSPAEQGDATAAIVARQATMEPVILGLARALLAEEPEGVAQRFVTYWEVRRSGRLDPDAGTPPPRAIAAL